MEPPAHLGDREYGIIGCNNHIAGGENPGSTAKARPVYQGDGWFWTGIEFADRIRCILRDEEVLDRRSKPYAIQPIKVGTGLKMFAICGDHDCPYLGICTKGACALQQRFDHFTVVGIIDMGTVQRDSGDAAFVDINQYTLFFVIAHGFCCPSIGCF